MDKVNSSQGLRNVFEQRAVATSKFFTQKFLGKISFNKIIETNLERYYEHCPSENALDRIQYFYIKKFLKYRLDANDRCSMAHSIEARVPFCDLEVVKVCLSVPPEKNLQAGTEKKALREAFKDILPKEIADRRKLALPESKDTALYELILEELRKNIELSDKTVWDIFNKNYIQNLYENAIKKITDPVTHGEVGNELTSEIPWTEEVQIRIKHIFVILTFLRWYQLYFIEKIF